MTQNTEIDYGPLAPLIGVWSGDKGLDMAPEPDGVESNPYFETITYSPAGDVTNAEEQVLSAIHYRQLVQRKSTGKVFHDQTGYWIWDAAQKTTMHAFTIPRGVSVLAGGVHTGAVDADGRIVLDVAAKLGDSHWSIVQSPFMAEKATTKAFRQELIIGGGRLSYSQITVLDIYGRSFEHTDENELTRS